ncbi:hypothetical protein ACROYT_G040917 [Oculina patagonica]
MVMNIYFENFDVQDGGQFCRLDYLSVWNENYQIFGKYCGQETGRTVTVTGEYAVIKFHSDDSGQTRGFLLSFSASLPVPPKVIIPAAVVRTVPGYKLTLPVTGSSPIYTAIIRNCTVLVNTTNTASILVDHEGNYTCVASSSYGSDLKKFSVIFNDCGPQCSHRWNKYFGNTLTCKNASSAKDILNCFPMMTDEMDLSNNAITNLTDEVFNGLRNLETLHLAFNAITYLPDGVFANLTEMGTLFLISNAITTLPNGVFANLRNLRLLYLSANGIKSLPDEVFKDLVYLQLLDLSSNDISFLSDRVFARLTNLEDLYLYNNAISNLTNGVLANLKNLRELVLSFNAIKYPPDGVFANLTKLRALVLPYNAITFLPDGMFLNKENMYRVYLSSNAITNLTDGVFANLKNLGILDLSSNRIVLLPDGVFSNLKMIKYLAYAHKALRKSSFNACFALYRVDLLQVDIVIRFSDYCGFRDGDENLMRQSRLSRGSFPSPLVRVTQETCSQATEIEWRYIVLKLVLFPFSSKGS